MKPGASAGRLLADVSVADAGAKTVADQSLRRPLGQDTSSPAGTRRLRRRRTLRACLWLRGSG